MSSSNLRCFDHDLYRLYFCSLPEKRRIFKNYAKYLRAGLENVIDFSLLSNATLCTCHSIAYSRKMKLFSHYRFWFD